MLLSALIAEDHDVTREGLRTLLEGQLDARVAAATRNGLDVIPLVEEHAPDLIVLDLGLPHLNGLDILRRLQKKDHHMHVVVLSMYGESTYVQDALRLGADAYVLKGSSLGELKTAIHTVMKGGQYLSSTLPDDLADLPTGSSSDDNDSLTNREREVLQLTAEGYTNREIGDKLHISHRTAEKHRENIQKKLNLRNAVEMAAYAHKHGLLADSPPAAMSE